MKYIKQFGIILSITCIGEILNYFIHLPIPASIYGLIILLLLLMTNIVKIDDVQDTGNFLINIMPLMFIPGAVKLTTLWDQLKSIWLPIIITTFATTFIVMIATGKSAELILKWERKSNEPNIR